LEIASALQNLGALVTLGLGILGLVRPAAAAALARVEPRGAMGLSEIRATYGGLFAALGAFALVAQDMVAFTMLGAAWIGAAAARLVSTFVDGAREPLNYGGVLFEGGIGLLLMMPG
jgi:hypothetical protein